ncbi:MAG: succinate dehydrogenase assembly factor 2 [Alphaproteobacteria bacterium]|nr:succinate dehydrogenase assembly factor 2 [Alphaproteobacteria bacterium]
MADSLEARRKRAVFRSMRRGTRESDIVLGGFARHHLGALDPAQIDRFEALLERNDNELLSWIGGWEKVPAEFDHDVMALLRRYRDTLERS